METIPALLLLATALVVTGALGLYAFRLRQQVRLRKQAQAGQQRAHEQQAADLRLSLRVIAQAMLDGQVDLSEGSLRLHTLLQGFAMNCDTRHQLAAFSLMAAALADQPLGAARDTLTAAGRQRLDRERAALEAEHGESLRLAARQLLVLVRVQ
ncbi:MAG: DUF2489 domain-containing protein [Gammaproteobacteria bacterium]